MKCVVTDCVAYGQFYHDFAQNSNIIGIKDFTIVSLDLRMVVRK